MSTNKTENLGLNQWVGSDPFRMADFNEDNEKIDAAVAAKAEQSALDAETAARTALAGQVAAKAEQSALDVLTGRVDKKAEQSALDALTGRVDKKAEQSTLETLTKQVAAKAEQSALTALTGRVGTLETGQLRYKYASYTGTGGVGNSNPNRLTFDFKPLMLLIVHPSNNAYGGFPWLYGEKYGNAYAVTSGSNNYVTITWENRAVQWYSSFYNSEAYHQLNEKNTTYWYLALGTV